ncbi:hypothetical protein CBP35_19680 (plasmid) [Acidovorax carolinensis]|uniref:3'-5' exonuclease n=1 Tax=Acidovorax carolinensis TaxID=553814 RepID=UPI000B5FA494|nr:3'-5' exonuclease [Acidovorax carolinensis]ART57136.1 hypothetical protein CBP35_19680 [Acidovorax carolinensis]
MIQSLDQGHRAQGLIIPGTGDHSPICEPTPPAPGQGNIDLPTLTFREDFAVVDVEVTGVDPDVDRIVDVAILRFRNGVPEVFHSLVNPGIPIPPTASAVHHITDEDVANSPYIEDLAEPIRAALNGALAVAHNAQLDALFVDPVTGVEPDPSQWICSLRLAKHLWPQAPRLTIKPCATGSKRPRDLPALDRTGPWMIASSRLKPSCTS